MSGLHRPVLTAMAALAAMAALSGCASEPPPPVDAAILAAGALNGSAPDQIDMGYSLMTIECADCHQPVHPLKHPMEEWDEILPRMGKKAALEESDLDDLRAYIIAVRTVQAQNKEAPRTGG